KCVGRRASAGRLSAWLSGMGRCLPAAAPDPVRGWASGRSGCSGGAAAIFSSDTSLPGVAAPRSPAQVEQSERVVGVLGVLQVQGKRPVKASCRAGKNRAVDLGASEPRSGPGHRPPARSSKACSCSGPGTLRPPRDPRPRRWPGTSPAVILDLMSEVTRILSAMEQGDPSAAEQLLPLVYDELRHLAAPH